MTSTCSSRTFRVGASALATCLFLWHGAATASPGAHGPNGEHLDGAGHSHSPASGAPRMEAHSELFELVATLADGELSILVDRYATNEPVLGATVEVEMEAGTGAGVKVGAGTLKASAKFHADHGDYAVADEAFLKAVSAAGEHALVFTVAAGAEADLLDGVLKVDAVQPDHPDDSHTPSGRWPWVLGAGVLLIGGTAAWRRRRPAESGRAA